MQPLLSALCKGNPKMDKLLENIDNLNVKIIFTVPNDPGHYIYKPVSHFLAIDEISNDQKIMKALDDWYLDDKKDYDLFAAKYPINGELTKQGDKIDFFWNRSLKGRPGGTTRTAEGEPGS